MQQALSCASLAGRTRAALFGRTGVDGLTGHAGRKGLASHGLMGHQIVRHLHQLFPVFLQDLGAVGVGPVHQPLHFPVQQACHFLGVGLGFLIIPANEHLFSTFIRYRADFLAHAIPGHHIPGQPGGPLDIVGSAGGNVLTEQSLRYPATQQGDDLLVHLIAGMVDRIFPGQAHRQAQGIAPRDDGHLMPGSWVGRWYMATAWPAS